MSSILRYIILILFFLVACGEKTNMKFKVTEQTKEDLQVLSKSRIFFGHQSVGFNIIDGVNDLIKETGIGKVNIIESDGKTDLPEFFFAHTRSGENTAPNTKCDAFSEFLTKDFVNKLDIAFLKFCYVDMRANDNPHQVFEYYKSVMDTIKAKYPNLTLLHLTIPLTTVQSGWKIPIKKILGKEIEGYKENINRFTFNKLLKEYYKEDPIFDLSTVESTYPNGSRESFEFDGHTYYAMVPDYTYDGGHLNDFGRKIVAKEMIHVLAEATHIKK